ncbi:MAG TPA: HhH-GPD-type base excision DNA repair protein [Nocardioidaceae bacterium]|nr:HhH-GPD-type base excision DNA repair protein [Nocardioidaceae bacterium]
MSLQIAQEDSADMVLSTNAFALLAGMLLDQQFPMERAFAGPATILDRFGTLDPAVIAGAPAEEFAEVCARRPAVHRFPGAMAGRLQALARHVSDEYGGDTAALWRTAASGQELLGRLLALPGFGQQKAKIFVALLGKQLGVRPEGWESVAGAYAEEGAFRSVADVRDRASLEKVRAFKQAQKAEAKAAQGSA